MKKFKSTFILIIILIASSCQKDDSIKPHPSHKQIQECNRCQGGWDLNDTTAVIP